MYLLRVCRLLFRIFVDLSFLSSTKFGSFYVIFFVYWVCVVSDIYVLFCSLVCLLF
jgi:hypothetical protein